MSQRLAMVRSLMGAEGSLDSVRAVTLWLAKSWLNLAYSPHHRKDCPMPETAASESGSTRAAAVLQTHLERLERPLRYATRQNFAHLAKLRDLEVYVQHHVQALQASPLPPGLLPLLQQLLQAVQDVDALPLLQKQERVRQAELLLAQMRAYTFHDSEPSPATASAEGRQLNSAPFPASVTAEGRLIKGG